MALTATGALASEFAAESAKAEAHTAGPAAPREELRFEVLLRSMERDGSIIGTPGAAGKLQDAGNTAESLERAVFGLNRGWDSRIGQTLIQPVGWAEASRNAEAIFARLA
jgi:hypothetical protein